MALKPVMIEKTITTAGTRVQVSTDDTILAAAIYCETPRANTGYIYIGGSTVSSSVFFHEFAIGKDTWSMSSPTAGSGGRAAGCCFKLSDLYVDSSVNGEKIKITYLQYVGA